jgi:hypothetical protein
VTDGQNGPRIRSRQIHHLVPMTDEDMPRIGTVVRIKAAHQRRLANTGRAREYDAFASTQFEFDAGQHRDMHAALQVQGEALGEGVGTKHHVGHNGIMPAAPN